MGFLAGDWPVAPKETCKGPKFLFVWGIFGPKRICSLIPGQRPCSVPAPSELEAKGSAEPPSPPSLPLRPSPSAAFLRPSSAALPSDLRPPNSTP